METTVTCPNTKCLHTFTPRKITRYCPKCKRILPLTVQEQIIIIMPDKQFCYRCGHEWQPIPGNKTRYCPKCGSHKWDRPRTQPKRYDSNQTSGYQPELRTKEINYRDDTGHYHQTFGQYVRII